MVILSILLLFSIIFYAKEFQKTNTSHLCYIQVKFASSEKEISNKIAIQITSYFWVDIFLSLVFLFQLEVSSIAGWYDWLEFSFFFWTWLQKFNRFDFYTWRYFIINTRFFFIIHSSWMKTRRKKKKFVEYRETMLDNIFFFMNI